MITVHLILNAHIDPVWLWPWPAGMDETIATCRSACERLDNHPDAIFTFGEAWGLRIVERTDPELFARIREHVKAGRWDLSGGWWIQPDCNLPGAFDKQIELGRAWLSDRFGAFPRAACNVDSFGHAATLPRIMRRHGQDRYVMMRPQEREPALPARLFLWRGFPEDEGVVTFRIAHDYATRTITREHVLAALEGLPRGVTHTMCFIGVGDHGGGPTERQIAWCREHADAIAGCRLVFSSPSRFFDAVEREGAELPMFEGELQAHAVGCYSVTRAIKLAVRRAEHALGAAEIAASRDPDPDIAHRLARAWEDVCFNHFHDTLAGTCIPSAYRQLEDQVGGAAAMADDIAHMAFRRRVAALGEDERQRIVLLNASERSFDGHIILDPWTGARWKPQWRLRDADGSDVPYQLVAPESIADPRPRVLLSIHLEPAGMKPLFLVRDEDEVESAIAAPARVDGDGLISQDAAIDFSDGPVIQFNRAMSLRPRLELFEDPTDTWAHGAVRIGTTLCATAMWDRPLIVDRGPLMVSAILRGRIDQSLLTAEWRLYRGEAAAELLLDIDWRALHKALKFVLPFAANRHTDGIPGGALCRSERDCERPLRDFTLLHGEPDVGIVCPDAFAIDVSADRAAFTLLRSPLMAHHDPAPAERGPRGIASDQGRHSFRFLFACGVGIDWLERRAAMYHRPLLMADYTRGMKAESRI
jgi:alpha-mannosidase